jgi:uncharacterized protein (TIGR02444 family)
MLRNGTAFWRFSLKTYRAAGVQQACLALQERCGADVNLLLFCGWVGRAGRMLDEDSLRLAVGRVGAWQSDVIVPLRLARRALKRQLADDSIAAMATSLRRRVLALELALEYVEQALLAELASRWPPPQPRVAPPQAVAANLAGYLALLGEAPGPAESAHLAHIARACIPARRAAASCQAAGSPPGITRRVAGT